jgi:hypothetical protein
MLQVYEGTNERNEDDRNAVAGHRMTDHKRKILLAKTYQCSNKVRLQEMARTFGRMLVKRIAMLSINTKGRVEDAEM